MYTLALKDTKILKVLFKRNKEAKDGDAESGVASAIVVVGDNASKD